MQWPLFEHLFKTIKTKYPLINKAYFRSNNTGCYHNGPLLLYLADIGKCTRVRLISYDLSDPQAGKDICDRKTAPMKVHIGRFVNENNLVTTGEVNKAIESHGGSEDVESVVEIDSTKELNNTNKVPGICLLYNFKFEKEGIRTWKAYRIRKGKILNYKDFQEQRKVELKVILPIAPCLKEPGTITQIFGRGESKCILSQ